jgi:probable rRNA maturation factor
MTDTDEPDPRTVTTRVQRGDLVVEGRDAAGDGPLELARWCGVALATLEAEGLAAGQVDLHFVDAQEMAALNQAHLGGRGPTDVVSFPYEDDARAAAGPGVVLGDVVVCPAVARAQAAQHTGRLDDELALLVVHGVLHVLGWDHAAPDDEAAMQAREAAILAMVNQDLSHPAGR